MKLQHLDVLVGLVAALVVSPPVKADRIFGTSAQAPVSHPSFPPWNATDDNWNTLWTSGGPAPASIDIFLPGLYTLDAIQTAAVMWPAPGYATHYLYGRTVDGGYFYVGAISAYIADGMWFWNPVSAPGVAFNAVTIWTVAEDTSWVGWRDIYVHGVPYMPPPPPPPPPPAVAVPLVAGNVTGRDLNGVGFLGHVGLYDGQNVFQVMNESQVVQSVSWDNFRSKDKPWNTLYPAIPSHTVASCYDAQCTYFDPPFGQQFSTQYANHAMARRARQIQLIGADYTLTTSVTVAEPRMFDQGAGVYYPARRGMYRCDTYVMDAFTYSHAIVGGGKSYSVLGFNTRWWHESSGESLDWASKMSGLTFMPGITPVQVYNRIASFQ